MSGRASIHDVALRAGVSVGTVSNVFNRPEFVAVETRRRVEDAVSSLRYVRNESARLLRSGQARIVGLIVPDVANPFFTDVARGVEDVTSAAGVLVIVCNTDGQLDKEAKYLTMLAEHHVLGVLHVPAGSKATMGALRNREIPVVLLDYQGPSRGRCSVSVNDVVGGRLAVGHLLGAGHRTVGFVGVGNEPPRQVVQRLAGARQAMVDASRSPDSLQLLTTSSLTVQGGVEAAKALLALPRRQRPTGVVCVNDLLAIGMLKELLRSGVRVPQDVAIVGYDDIAFAEDAAVPLTSIRQPRNQLGRRAAELLLDEAAGGPHRHSSVVFEPELIARDSSR